MMSKNMRMRIALWLGRAANWLVRDQLGSQQNARIMAKRRADCIADLSIDPGPAPAPKPIDPKPKEGMTDDLG